jgi:hypothetical protein
MIAAATAVGSMSVAGGTWCVTGADGFSERDMDGRKVEAESVFAPAGISDEGSLGGVVASVAAREG